MLKKLLTITPGQTKIIGDEYTGPLYGLNLKLPEDTDTIRVLNSLYEEIPSEYLKETEELHFRVENLRPDEPTYFYVDTKEKGDVWQDYKTVCKI